MGCMKDPNTPKRNSEPQPWHPADEKAAPRRRGAGAPLCTHSFTGAGTNVGMPAQAKDAERGTVPDPAAPEEGVDPLREPRAGGGSGPLGPR